MADGDERDWGGGYHYDPGWYKLVGHEPVKVHDLLEWAEWMERNWRLKRVKATYKFGKHVRISTVFLGLDHGMGAIFGGDLRPVLFETMIFGGRDTQYQERYHTWDEAVKGHKRAVRRARG